MIVSRSAMVIGRRGRHLFGPVIMLTAPEAIGPARRFYLNGGLREGAWPDPLSTISSP